MKTIKELTKDRDTHFKAIHDRIESIKRQFVEIQRMSNDCATMCYVVDELNKEAITGKKAKF